MTRTLYCCIHAQRVHSVYSNLLVAVEVGVFCLFLDKSVMRSVSIYRINDNSSSKAIKYNRKTRKTEAFLDKGGMYQ